MVRVARLLRVRWFDVGFPPILQRESPINGTVNIPLQTCSKTKTRTSLGV